MPIGRDNHLQQRDPIPRDGRRLHFHTVATRHLDDNPVEITNLSTLLHYRDPSPSLREGRFLAYHRYLPSGRIVKLIEIVLDPGANRPFTAVPAQEQLGVVFRYRTHDADIHGHVRLGRPGLRIAAVIERRNGLGREDRAALGSKRHNKSEEIGLESRRVSAAKVTEIAVIQHTNRGDDIHASVKSQHFDLRARRLEALGGGLFVGVERLLHVWGYASAELVGIAKIGQRGAISLVSGLSILRDGIAGPIGRRIGAAKLEGEAWVIGRVFDRRLASRDRQFWDNRLVGDAIGDTLRISRMRREQVALIDVVEHGLRVNRGGKEEGRREP